ncbi:MAG TPA: hypothetical protein VFQ95_09860 [Rhodanobacteraceae bacterium]|nr:hypothetical protein [Rhodanobacteraceae bacterium]
MSTAAARLRRADAGPIAHRAAAMEVIDAYNEYGSHFTDPTWKALTP